MIMKRSTFFMVYLENERTPAFRHSTLDGAEREAQRLSKEHGKKAYVLCALKSYKFSDFIVEDHRPDDDLPF